MNMQEEEAKGFGFEKKRERFAIDIRKQNRQAIFNKRRFKVFNEFDLEEEAQTEDKKYESQIIDANLFEHLLPVCKQQVIPSQLFDLLSMATSEDIMKKHYGMIGLRKLLAVEDNPPIQEVIDAGIVPYFMQLAQQTQFKQLKLEAVWCMTNIASGTHQHCKVLAEKGAIQLFVECLKENEKGIVDQAVWAIGNMAADQISYRDKILKIGGLTALIKVTQLAKSKTMINNGTWAISNLCRGSPLPQYSRIVQSVPILSKILKSGIITEPQILSDLTWALSYLCGGNSKKRIQKVMDQGILQSLFKLCSHESSQVSVPALRIIGNFAMGNQLQIEQLIKYGIFELGNKLLDHQKKFMRKEMCWILSNITVGPQRHVQAFISNRNLVKKLTNLFQTDIADVRKEICWVFANMGFNGNLQSVILFFKQNDLIRQYLLLLNEEEQQVLESTLQALDKVFQYGQKQKVNGINILLQDFEEGEGSKQLQALQFNQSNKVYSLVIEILSKFYNVREEQQFGL